jgi:regulator of nonsense transcripts 1
MLKNAAVVCVTCISAGGGVMEKGMPAFQCVLLDEAAQATEAACLVPVVKGCRSLVMCGDHHQLPPTILYRAAELEGESICYTVAV